MAEIVRYEHVDICYGDVSVVRDISFSLDEGRILGIAGESGSGKTTLIRSAMGLLPDQGRLTGGQILFKSRDISRLSEKERRTINGPGLGMVFQNAGSSFCPVRTIGAQLFEAMREHRRISRKEFQDKAEWLLGQLGFEDVKKILKSYPFELSGGMQQRAGIAAAMLLEPSVLLADEPTSALNQSLQKQVAEEMLMIRERFHTAIILVTHNLALIDAMADDVLVMKNGEMVEYGSREKVLNTPEMEYTKALLAAVPGNQMSSQVI